MTPRERVKAVFEGRTPDQVPLMLDLSHWYKKNNNVFFDLGGFREVESGLVELHKRVNAVCYVEMGAFYGLSIDDPDIRIEVSKDNGIFTTRISTPLGELTDERIFDQGSYSYNIRKHLLDTVDDFAVVRMVMERYRVTPNWEKYRAWIDALGELAFPYVQLPYSGFGYLISRYFGVEKTTYAVFDHPEEVQSLVDAVNANNLRILDAVIDGPFDVLFISDNLDSNVQGRDFFDTYTRPYYTEVARRVHAKGKYLAIHVDGEMRGLLSPLHECGVDCVDAATPSPMFALTPQAARAEAGKDLILSGGIPATVFGSIGTDDEFESCVKRWLDTRHASPRLIMAAGDQVPTDAPYERIARLSDLVSRYGRY